MSALLTRLLVLIRVSASDFGRVTGDRRTISVASHLDERKAGASGALATLVTDAAHTDAASCPDSAAWNTQQIRHADLA